MQEQVGNQHKKYDWEKWGGMVLSKKSTLVVCSKKEGGQV